MDQAQRDPNAICTDDPRACELCADNPGLFSCSYSDPNTGGSSTGGSSTGGSSTGGSSTGGSGMGDSGGGVPGDTGTSGYSAPPNPPTVEATTTPNIEVNSEPSVEASGPSTSGEGGGDTSTGYKFVSTPDGKLIRVPENWDARVADNGRGLVFQQPGASGNGNMIRIMDPTPAYPRGYAVYYNEYGQPLDVFGRPSGRAFTHIALDYIGQIFGWP